MKRSLHRLVVGVVFAGLAVGGTASPAAAGNAGAAKTCQKGGFATVVRQDGTGFKNVGACVSYAAKGGVLKPNPVITVSLKFIKFSGGVCVVDFSYTGAPKTYYPIVVRTVTGLTDISSSEPSETDASGRFKQTRLFGNSSIWISYTVNGVTTGLQQIAC